MQVSCPECHRQFKVSNAALGSGRDVKCSLCLHVWFQEPEEDDLDLAFVEEGESVNQEGQEASEIKEDIVQEAVDVPETIVPPAEEENIVEIEQVAEEPKSSTQWRSAILVFFFVFFLLSGVLLLLKPQIIKVWPASVRFYKAVGIYQGNPLSIFKWENMISEIRLDPHQNPYLFVGADLRNTTQKEQKIPYIYVELTENNQVIEEKLLKIDAKKIKADDIYQLKIGLASYSNDAVTARLILSEEIKGADEDKGRDPKEEQAK